MHAPSNTTTTALTFLILAVHNPCTASNDVSIISDLENGSRDNYFCGGYWFVEDDHLDDGNTTINNMVKNADGTYTFLPTFGAGNTQSGGTPDFGALVDFKLGTINPSSWDAAWGSMVIVGTTLAAQDQYIDLTGATKIEFYAKVERPKGTAATVDMRVEVCTAEFDPANNGDYGYYHIIIPISGSWSKYTVPLDTIDRGFGKLQQWDWSIANNGPRPFNIKKVSGIQWTISEDGNLLAWKDAAGALYIDDVSISPFAPPFNNHNVGVQQILGLQSKILDTNSRQPKAFIKNYGRSVESFPVLFTIGAAYQDSVYVTSLGPNLIDTLTFKSWKPQINVTVLASCSTALVDDDCPLNNKCEAKITQSMPIPFVLGKGIEAELSAVSEIDAYTVTAKKGSWLGLRMKPLSSVYALVRVFDQIGTMVYEKNSSNGTIIVLGDFFILDSGTYSIEVSAPKGQTFYYQIWANTSEHISANAPHLPLDSIITDTIPLRVDENIYTLSGDKNDWILLRMKPKTAVDATLRLFNCTSDSLLTDQHLSNGIINQTLVHLPDSGAYQIRVFSTDGASPFGYSLYACTNSHSRAHAKTIPPGATYYDTITSNFGVNSYTICCGRDEWLGVRAKPNSTIISVLRIFSPSGPVVFDSQGAAGSLHWCSLNAPDSGDYLVQTFNSTGTASYTYAIDINTGANLDKTIPACRAGNSYFDTIKTSTESKFYRIFCRQGDWLRCRIKPEQPVFSHLFARFDSITCINSKVQSGTLNDASTFIARDGTYWITIQSATGGETFPYALYFNLTSCIIDSSRSLSINDSLVDTLPSPVHINSYSFQGEQGGCFILRVKPNTGASSTVMVRTNKDSVISINAVDSGRLNEIEYVLPCSGAFAIQVMSSNGSAGFDYSLKLDTSFVTRNGTSPSRPSPPNAFTLGGNFPNPFKTTTQLRFTVPAVGNDASSQSKVFIAVYDLRGRVVRVLVNGLVQPGYHTIAFNATDTSGKALRNGVFFCRMQASGYAKTITLMLSR